MAPKYRCTYEWDRVVGRDERNDPILKRYICTRAIHHVGNHKAITGHTSETPTTRGIK